MIKYWNTAAKIDEETSMETISDIFAQLIEALGISTANPTIKKYKNCVYMGGQQSASAYEGIIYYFDCKLYYGQLLKGAKHGYGVEIDFQRGTTCAGSFEQGKKNGLFCIQKERENYEGELLHGLYHGKGKLMTEDCVYTGAFENGRKHGFGEEFYPKTGLRLRGCFKHGEFQHLDGAKALPDPTSEAQLRNKPEKVLVKSNSYDIDFQLQKTFKKQVEGLVRNQLETPASREDSKSLFDIIANTRKVNKYDYSLEDAVSRFPKIRLEGIQTRLKEADPEQGQEGFHLRKELETPHRRYHSQQQKSFASSHTNTDLEEPLLRHRLNTPIHRLK